MTDSIQILLTAVITILTTLLVVIGIQLFLVLKEFQKTLKKTNGILEDASKVTRAVVQPVEEASSFLSGLKDGFGLIKNFKKIFEHEKD